MAMTAPFLGWQIWLEKPRQHRLACASSYAAAARPRIHIVRQIVLGGAHEFGIGAAATVVETRAGARLVLQERDRAAGWRGSADAMNVSALAVDITAAPRPPMRCFAYTGARLNRRWFRNG